MTDKGDNVREIQETSFLSSLDPLKLDFIVSVGFVMKWDGPE